MGRRAGWGGGQVGAVRCDFGLAEGALFIVVHTPPQGVAFGKCNNMLHLPICNTLQRDPGARLALAVRG